MFDFKEIKYVSMMLLAVISWAFAFPFIKIGLEELSFVNLTILRFFIVCCAFLLIILLQRKRFSKLNKKDIIPIFLLGFIGVISYHLLLNYGELFVSPAVASLIISTIPIQIAIFSPIFLKEKITFKIALGIIIALIGVVIISIWGTESVTLEVRYIGAVIAVIICATVSAFYTIGGKKLLTRYSGLSLTAYAIILSSLALIPLSFNNSIIPEVSKLSINGWFAVLFLGIFSTVFGYSVWYIALEKRSASEISVYLYLTPVLSTIFTYFLLDDQITLFFIAGGILVITGLIIVNHKNNKNNKKID